jgi:hypothetical protein
MAKGIYRTLRFDADEAIYLVRDGEKVGELRKVISEMPLSVRFPRLKLGYLGIFDIVVACDTDDDFDAIINIDRDFAFRDSKFTNEIFEKEGISGIRRLIVPRHDDLRMRLYNEDSSHPMLGVKYKTPDHTRKLVGLRFWESNSVRDA